MPRMIFVNLPVKDLEASKGFFGQLGFAFEPQFTDESAARMVIEDNIFAMLLAEDRFKDFINGEIAHPDTTEVLTCLSAASREEIDGIVEKAITAGGRAWKPAMDMDHMYGASFQDLDGHVWELLYVEQQ